MPFSVRIPIPGNVVFLASETRQLAAKVEPASNQAAVPLTIVAFKWGIVRSAASRAGSAWGAVLAHLHDARTEEKKICGN
jgi:hypothetical protein